MHTAQYSAPSRLSSTSCCSLVPLSPAPAAVVQLAQQAGWWRNPWLLWRHEQRKMCTLVVRTRCALKIAATTKCCTRTPSVRMQRLVWQPCEWRSPHPHRQKCFKQLPRNCFPHNQCPTAPLNFNRIRPRATMQPYHCSASLRALPPSSHLRRQRRQRRAAVHPSRHACFDVSLDARAAAAVAACDRQHARHLQGGGGGQQRGGT